MEIVDDNLPGNPVDADLDRSHWQRFAQSRTSEMRDQLVKRYIGFARVTAARLYQRRVDNSVQFSDYLQYARIGLVEAIDHYDPAHEVPFEAFASYRVRGAVLNGLKSETEVAAQRAYWWRRAREQCESTKQQDARSDRRASLAELVSLTVGFALAHVIDHDDGEVIDETLAANPYAMTELAQLKGAVRSLLPMLPERECELMRRHYEDHVEFQQIAAEWGVTKGRVSQLHAQALRRLREMLRVLDRRL